MFRCCFLTDDARIVYLRPGVTTWDAGHTSSVLQFSHFPEIAKKSKLFIAAVTYILKILRGLINSFYEEGRNQVNSVYPQLCRSLSHRFWLAILATICLIFSTFLQSVLQNLQQSGNLLLGYHDELIFKALSSDTFFSFAPVLAGLPFAANYLEDVKSKFTRFILVRGSYHGYLLGLLFGCWLSGGFALLLGSVSAYGLTALLLLPMERVIDNPPELGVQIILQMTLLFFNGGLWSIIGMTMSTIMESKYIAYASPFIVYYLLVILYERYFPNAWLLYPKNWLDPEIWPYGVGSAALFLLELTFLCGLVFYIRAKRRLEQL